MAKSSEIWNLITFDYFNVYLAYLMTPFNFFVLEKMNVLMKETLENLLKTGSY